MILNILIKFFLMGTPDGIDEASTPHKDKWYQEFHINMLDATVSLTYSITIIFISISD
ncbi:hypothetical protein HQN86_21005 [Pedobacter panaciterrae]|uniref:hypothetical protein n=1 Tax=Pedobacter panaciterrae TaxID=363849 RepID=UPI00155DAB17|nr:hypothetical protein [Pedobacter panaciterrae]NQX56113.1 hypothetical protein [Pedobacter panaciterrae]